MNLASTYARLPQELTAAVHAVRMCARTLGIKTYLVGGIVRDMVMGRKNYDLDICVEGDAHALADAVGVRLNAEVRKHAAFTTATVDCKPYPIDLAMCREEIYEKPGALPTVRLSTLAADLKRRDFTINAMAMSLNEDDFGDLIDPYDGLKDIRQSLIHVLHNKSFIDDPTRLFRAERFKERFSFTYERRTNRLIKEALLEGCFRTISPQRVRKELYLVAEEEHSCESMRSLYRMTGFSFLPGEVCREKPDIAFLAHLVSYARALGARAGAGEPISYGLLLFIFLLFRASVQEKEDIATLCGFTRAEKKMFVKLSPQAIAQLDHAAEGRETDKYLDALTREGIIFVCATLRNACLREYILSTRLQTKGT